MGLREARQQASGICYQHAGVRAENMCSRCNRPICEVCSTQTLDGITCPGCAVREAGNRRARRFLIGVVAVAAVAGLVIFLVMNDPERGASARAADAGPQSAPAAPRNTVIDGFDYKGRALIINTHQEVLRRTPCDGKTAVKLGEEMNRAGNQRGSIAFVEQYEKDCGEYRRLLWVSFSAHKELRELDKAEQVVTRLVEARPTDSDYWWWRGEVRVKRGDLEQALLDYRQSMATRPNKFATTRLAEEIGPCPGAFAHQLYAYDKPSPSRRWAEDEVVNLMMAGNCARMVGTGTATVKVDPANPLKTARVKVNGRAGTFAINQSSGTVALTSAFARRAKVTAAEPTRRLYVAGKFAPGLLTTLAEVRVGEATATDVPAAVVEELADGIDGVLGLSYLWRFSTEVFPDAVEIIGRQDEPTAPPR